jgi:hypothetical protein
MKKQLGVSLCLGVLLAALVGCEKAPEVRFAPYDKSYDSKPDFAQLEHDLPLTTAELDRITPKNIAKLDQEQVDQIYARLSAGPIPDGAYEGTFFFAEGGGVRRLSEVFGGIKGLVVEMKLEKLERLGQALWKGKVFYRDQMLLRNMIRDKAVLEPIVDDTASLPTTEIGGKSAWLLFPAKLYCGQSLLDGRRESIIIDYAFSDEVEGYREKPDFLAGRRGLKVRDEIRMVRPGFYLGRAYMGRAFALNFTLYNAEVAEKEGAAFRQTGKVNQDCWVGTQEHKVVAAP